MHRANQFLRAIFDSFSTSNLFDETSNYVYMRRDAYKAYYNRAIQHLYKFHDDHGMRVADAAFAVIRDAKNKGKYRKNGYMPGISHEIDIALPFVTLLQKDRDFAALIPEIEKQYGSMQELYGAIYGHDLFEEFGLFPSDFNDRVHAIFERRNWDMSDTERDIHRNITQNIERLTDCRKFSVSRLKTMGIEQDIFNGMKPGDDKDLSELKDIFWPKMDILPDIGRENFQVFARWDEGKQAPKLVVTRYGYSSEDTPQHLASYGVDPAQYFDAQQANVMCDLVKRADTNQNFSDMIEKGDRSASSKDYLDDKKTIMDNYGLGTRHYYATYAQSPFKNVFESLDLMRLLLMKCNRLYFTILRQNEKKSLKFPNVLKMELDFSKFVSTPNKHEHANCNYLYKHVGGPSHVISKFMMQLSDAPDISGVGLDSLLYEHVRGALVRDVDPGLDKRLKELSGTFFTELNHLDALAMNCEP